MQKESRLIIKINQKLQENLKMAKNAKKLKIMRIKTRTCKTGYLRIFFRKRYNSNCNIIHPVIGNSHNAYIHMIYYTIEFL